MPIGHEVSDQLIQMNDSTHKKQHLLKEQNSLSEVENRNLINQSDRNIKPLRTHADDTSCTASVTT
jgi:hypothetical protein